MFTTVDDNHQIKKGDYFQIRYGVSFGGLIKPSHQTIKEEIESTGKYEITGIAYTAENDLVVSCIALTDNTPIVLVAALIAGVLISLFVLLWVKDFKVWISPAGYGFEMKPSLGSISFVMVAAVIAFIFFIRK